MTAAELLLNLDYFEKFILKHFVSNIFVPQSLTDCLADHFNLKYFQMTKHSIVREDPKWLIWIFYFQKLYSPPNVWWENGPSCSDPLVYWFQNETKTNSQTSQTSQNSLFKIPLPSLPSEPLIRNSNLHYIRHTTVDVTRLQT